MYCTLYMCSALTGLSRLRVLMAVYSMQFTRRGGAFSGTI
jgi:hypothetical protein